MPFSIYQLTVQTETDAVTVEEDRCERVEYTKLTIQKRTLVNQLHSFEDAVYNFPCVISAAGLLDCTRGLIVRVRD